MELKQVLHMKEGTGKDSYANNSKYQERVIEEVKTILEESLQHLYQTKLVDRLVLADLGCSSGPNVHKVLLEIIDAVDQTCQSLNHQLPEFQVFLNDLPGNDFNTLFKSFPNLWEKLGQVKGNNDFQVSCFISGTPGSFYGRLFPRNFLHFAHSSYCLHWLSQVPKGLVTKDGGAFNKGNVNIGKSSPPGVYQTYKEQFEKDFTLFLSLRSQELVSGGHMVLTIAGSVDSREPSPMWTLLSIALNDMVLEGLIEEEKADAFNIPMYYASAQEVKKLIEIEGSFTLRKLHTFDMKWDTPKLLADGIRAITEPLLTSSAFEGPIIDDLFRRYEEISMNYYMATGEVELHNLAIYVSRNG
ncbi:hypothetical protein Ancab_039849 [Ancistrocladus abbreviatus]